MIRREGATGAEVRPTALPAVLRQWRDADLAPFAAMNADPEVMRYFPRLQTEEESRVFVARQRELIATRGWGLWALETGGEFAGFVGLSVPRFEAAFTPCVEVGWRLRTEFWGRGLAFAAAARVLAQAFGALALPEIVSFTTVANERSRRLMARLGLRRDPAEDFDHPAIEPGNPVRPHVLYRIRAGNWTAPAVAAGVRLAA